VGNSRLVISSQTDIHPRLAELVARHRAHPYRAPIAAHNQRAFDDAQAWLQRRRGPLILDSFCGVGASTVYLARRYPEAAVIGIDRSAERLARHTSYRVAGVDNYLLLRADTEDLWRLGQQAGWRPALHSLLYPNPWPRPAQLRRRIHGSPLLPTLLALGGTLWLRSNWELYAREFAFALELSGLTPRLRSCQPEPPITPFERKYLASGQTIYECCHQDSTGTAPL
jgi:tRNA G46 methylase TrmB